MLRMDVYEVFAQALEELERGRGVVDEGAALALGRDLTAHDALFLVAIDVFLLEHSPYGCVKVGEAGFDDAALSPRTDRGAIGALPHQEGDRTEEDTLTSARLTRDDGEVRGELDGELIDEHEVPNAETLKHN